MVCVSSGFVKTCEATRNVKKGMKTQSLTRLYAFFLVGLDKIKIFGRMRGARAIKNELARCQRWICTQVGACQLIFYPECGIVRIRPPGHSFRILPAKEKSRCSGFAIATLVLWGVWLCSPASDNKNSVGISFAKILRKLDFFSPKAKKSSYIRAPVTASAAQTGAFGPAKRPGRACLCCTLPVNTYTLEIPIYQNSKLLNLCIQTKKPLRWVSSPIASALILNIQIRSNILFSIFFV